MPKKNDSNQANIKIKTKKKIDFYRKNIRSIIMGSILLLILLFMMEWMSESVK